MGSKTGNHAHVLGSETTQKLVLTPQAGREQPVPDMGLMNTSEVNQQFKKGWESSFGIGIFFFFLVG